MVISVVDMFIKPLTTRISCKNFNIASGEKNRKKSKTKLSTVFKNRVNRAKGQQVEKVLKKQYTSAGLIKRIKPL